MTRPKKNSYASDEELSWFRLDNYSDVLGRESSTWKIPALRAATCAQWAMLIRDRVELLRFIRAGELDYVTGLFEKIKVTPLTPLGFAQRYSGATHPANTPTIKAMTANRVKWLNDAMIRSEASEQAIIDVQLASDPETVFGDYAHVMVNMRATDAQLLADFKKWRNAWRACTKSVTQGDYDNKIQTWSQAQVLPYMDLELFILISGKAISEARKFAMLLPQGTITERSAQRRRLADMKELVFSDDMPQIIAHLAESEAMPIPGKTGG
jgi:hypothetical protein